LARDYLSFKPTKVYAWHGFAYPLNHSKPTVGMHLFVLLNHSKPTVSMHLLVL